MLDLIRRLHPGDWKCPGLENAVKRCQACAVFCGCVSMHLAASSGLSYEYSHYGGIFEVWQQSCTVNTCEPQVCFYGQGVSAAHARYTSLLNGSCLIQCWKTCPRLPQRRNIMKPMHNLRKKRVRDVNHSTGFPSTLTSFRMGWTGHALNLPFSRSRVYKLPATTWQNSYWAK